MWFEFRGTLINLTQISTIQLKGNEILLMDKGGISHTDITKLTFDTKEEAEEIYIALRGMLCVNLI